MFLLSPSMLGLGVQLRGILMHPFKNCFFVCYSTVVLRNASPVDFQRQVIWGSIPQVAVLKVRVLNVQTSSLQVHAGDLALLLKEAGGRGQSKYPLALLGSGQDSSQLKCKLIRSWTLRQQLGKYVVQHPPGRNWEISVCVCSLCSELGEIARGSAQAPCKNCLFVCYNTMGLVKGSPFGSQSQMIWGAVPQVAALKVGALEIQSKHCTNWEEAGVGGFKKIIRRCSWVGFIVRVCLILSYTFLSGYFLSFPMCKSH